MEWVDQLLKRHEEAKDQRNAVTKVADEIYQDLWKAILEIVRLDSLRMMGLKYNGSPLNHTVTMGNRTVVVRLDEDKCGITANVSDGPNVSLKLRCCADAQGGSVCIKHEGVVVSYPEAAKKIMEPFIFGGESPYAFLSLGA